PSLGSEEERRARQRADLGPPSGSQRLPPPMSQCQSQRSLQWYKHSADHLGRRLLVFADLVHEWEAESSSMSPPRLVTDLARLLLAERRVDWQRRETVWRRHDDFCLIHK